MKKVLSSIAVLAALAAGFVLLTGFRGGCGSHHHADAASVDKMITAQLDDALDDLKATDAQRAQVLALKDKVVKDAAALHQGQADAKKALVAQWDSDSLTPKNKEQIHALVDERIEAIKVFAHQAADAGIELHGILTPEQRAQISKKIHRRMDDR